MSLVSSGRVKMVLIKVLELSPKEKNEVDKGLYLFINKGSTFKELLQLLSIIYKMIESSNLSLVNIDINCDYRIALTLFGTKKNLEEVYKRFLLI